MKSVFATILLTLSFSVPVIAEQSDPFNTSKTVESGQSDKDIVELKREFQMLKRDLMLREQQKQENPTVDPANKLGIKYQTQKIESFLEAAGKYYVRLSGSANNPHYIELSKEEFLGVKAQYNTIVAELSDPDETGGK